jgi:hypothetical protein
MIKICNIKGCNIILINSDTLILYFIAVCVTLLRARNLSSTNGYK